LASRPNQAPYVGERAEAGGNVYNNLDEPGLQFRFGNILLHAKKNDLRNFEIVGEKFQHDLAGFINLYSV
jgi:hypothetical protein